MPALSRTRATQVATALNPVIGYEKAAEVVKAALKEGKTVKQVVLEKKLLTEEQYNQVGATGKAGGPPRQNGVKGNKYDGRIGVLKTPLKMGHFWPFLLDRGLSKRKIPSLAITPAQVAQLVEHFLGKEEVTGSIPVLGSMIACSP